VIIGVVKGIIEGIIGDGSVLETKQQNSPTSWEESVNTQAFTDREFQLS